MKKKNKKSAKSVCGASTEAAREIAQIWENSDEIKSDVLGSYTGNPIDTDRPIQDADDL